MVRSIEVTDFAAKGLPRALRKHSRIDRPYIVILGHIMADDMDRLAAAYDGRRILVIGQPSKRAPSLGWQGDGFK